MYDSAIDYHKNKQWCRMGRGVNQYIRDVLCSMIVWATQTIDRNRWNTALCLAETKNKKKERETLWLGNNDFSRFYKIIV